MKRENQNREALENIFDTLMSHALSENCGRHTVVNKERYGILKCVRDGMTEIFGEEAKITLRPAFTSGGASVRVPDVVLGRADMEKLKWTLLRCTTFEIVPLVNDKIGVNITVEKVYE